MRCNGVLLLMLLLLGLVVLGFVLLLLVRCGAAAGAVFLVLRLLLRC